MERRGFEGAAIQVPLASSSYDEFFSAEYPRLVPLLHALVADRTRAETIAFEMLDDVRRRWDELSAEHDLVWSTHRKALQRATRRPKLGRSRRAPGTSGAMPSLPDPELWAAVQRLSRRERFVVALHYVDFMPLGEVAALLGCSPATLTSLMTSAHSSLARTLPAKESRSATQPSAFEQIDGRLRRAGDTLRASAPAGTETATRLATATTARRRRWIVPATIATAAVVTLAVVVVRRGDDDTRAAADVSVPDTLAPPPTSPPPSTGGQTATTLERTQIIEPTPKFEARYDRPTGFMWVSSNWNWDDNNGSCITISRRNTAPDPDELEPPKQMTGCVDGGRHGVVLTARIGRRLIHLTKDIGANEWNLAALPFGLRLCNATRAELDLQPGVLYEVACSRSGPQVRRFPQRPVDALTIVTAAGAELPGTIVFDGDNRPPSAQTQFFGMEAPGLNVYVTTPPGSATTCYVAIVAGATGWYDACTKATIPGGLLLVTGHGAFLVRHDGRRISAAAIDDRPDGTLVGCYDGQLSALRHIDSHGLWNGVACAGSVLLATQPAGLHRIEKSVLLGARPENPSGQSAAATEFWVAAVRGERWQNIVSGDEASARSVVRCGGGMPCSASGDVTPFPVSALTPWGYDNRSVIDDVTADVRQLIGGATDLASIGIRVSADPPGSSGPSNSTVDDFDSLDVAIGPSHRYLDEDFRILTTTYFDPSLPGRSIYFVVWTTRVPRSSNWSVLAAYRITNCFTETGDAVACDNAP